MKAELRAGATVEFTTPEEMRDLLQSHARTLARALRVKPTGMALSQAGPAPVAGLSVIDFGSPPQGFEWEVRRYFVTGQDPTVALAGSSAVVFVAEGIDVVTPFDAIDTTALRAVPTIPNSGFFTDDQVVVGFGAHLLIRCAGLGVNTVFANAYVIQRNATQEQTPELVIPVPANGKV